VKVAGHVLGVPVCAWEQDLPLRNGAWNCVATLGEGDQESCKLFFSFFLQLVVSVFVDSERALFLTGYGTHGYCLVSSELPFSGQLVAAGL
jgi:hypothetical protein